jgi:hypothetical protein
MLSLYLAPRLERGGVNTLDSMTCLVYIGVPKIRSPRSDGHHAGFYDLLILWWRTNRDLTSESGMVTLLSVAMTCLFYGGVPRVLVVSMTCLFYGGVPICT